MIVAITGTPGTGKTTVGDILKKKGFTVIDLKQEAIDNNFILGLDKERNSKIVDVERLDEHIGTFKKNEVIERSVTDGNKTITARAKVIKQEKITIDGVQYDTYLLEPEIERIGGVFEKDPNAKIKLWLTADHRHIPVKIASRVAVGSFIGELQSIHP